MRTCERQACLELWCLLGLVAGMAGCGASGGTKAGDTWEPDERGDFLRMDSTPDSSELTAADLHAVDSNGWQDSLGDEHLPDLSGDSLSDADGAEPDPSDLVDAMEVADAQGVDGNDGVMDVAPDWWELVPDDTQSDQPQLPDLVEADSTPAVVWDNSVYTPAGEPFPIVGFGAGTLGGFQEGHDVYHVTSLADDGEGTLREGLRSNNLPRVIVFDLDGTITLAGALLVPSNITVDGRGRTVVVKGKGFVVPGSDQVILVNLALEDVIPDTEDGLQIGSAAPDPSENVVIDHVRFTQHGDNGNAKNTDEAISVVFGSRNITIAWCRFENWEKILLAGNGDAPAALDSQITLTWHHSYAYQTGRRHPQARYGRYHLFNNFLDDWRMYGSGILSPYPESFGSQIQDDGRMLLQGEMVRRHEHAPYDWFSQANDASRCESGGDLLEYNTWVLPDSTAALKFGVGCAKAEAFDPPYQVEPETPGQGLVDRILLYSGNTL